MRAGDWSEWNARVTHCNGTQGTRAGWLIGMARKACGRAWLTAMARKAWGQADSSEWYAMYVWNADSSEWNAGAGREPRYTWLSANCTEIGVIGFKLCPWSHHAHYLYYYSDLAIPLMRIDLKGFQSKTCPHHRVQRPRCFTREQNLLRYS